MTTQWIILSEVTYRDAECHNEVEVDGVQRQRPPDGHDDGGLARHGAREEAHGEQDERPPLHGARVHIVCRACGQVGQGGDIVRDVLGKHRGQIVEACQGGRCCWAC